MLIHLSYNNNNNGQNVSYIILHGLATSNEGDTYTVCNLLLDHRD